MQLYQFSKPDSIPIPPEPNPPQKYTVLKDLVLSSTACVQAIVVSCKDIKRTAKGDYCLTFYIKDVSINPSKVTVTMFRKSDSEIPELSSGDLIILDKVKVQEFNGQPQILILYQSEISVYKLGSDNPESHVNLQTKLKKLPEYLSYLYLWNNQGIESIPQPGNSAIQNDCVNSLSCPLNTNNENSNNIELNTFSELKPGIGMFSIPIEQKKPNCFEIIATDYTSNCYSSPIGDQENIPDYFFGKNMLFRVTFWDEHSRNPVLKRACPGSMLLLRECVAKSSKYFKLELVLHGSRSEQKNNILALPKQHSDNLLRRKLEFLKSIEDSKKALKEQSKILTTISHPSAPISRFDDVIKNPKAPYLYRIQSQVTGFYPDLKKDGVTSFCKPLCPSCLSNEISLSEAKCFNCNLYNIVPSWTYNFFLKLESPEGSHNSYLPVLVFNQQAIKFLRNLPATNLEKDLQSSIQLKALLDAILDQTIELCIMSYKVSSDNTVCFQLFDTEMTENCSS